ncbi:MarR family winged helix-turn-helix transcriptional regulator [Asanoa siamensis]|uniref:MarR family transcriptional regulator n=1 Tax=Asanoa siamensis TaxID=926357 RepID=A0ABQ4CJM9_9ACTN|nr:MarR family winged helix-turn-helix transcriptional regulator [Asanoa siamensis]GIF71047.1 MarR family transcriptional regulator [Asanoa siamensis]
MTRWLTDDEMRAWLGYRRLRTLLDLQITRDLAADSGLSDADYDVLSTLGDAPAHRMRLGELAASIRWSVSRLSHHVSRMHQRGLVTRDDCETDGRGATVVLTDAGWATIQAAATRHVASVRRHFIDLLDPADLAALTTIAGKVLTHLDEVTPPDPRRGGARTQRDGTTAP